MVGGQSSSFPVGLGKFKCFEIDVELGFEQKLSPTPTAIVQKWQMEMKVIEKMEDGDL
jgi:hypothetical protein